MRLKLWSPKSKGRFGEEGKGKTGGSGNSGGKGSGKFRLEDGTRTRISWASLWSGGGGTGEVHVLGGAAEELLGRALHDLGWPGREAHEKTLGALGL